MTHYHTIMSSCGYGAFYTHGAIFELDTDKIVKLKVLGKKINYPQNVSGNNLVIKKEGTGVYKNYLDLVYAMINSLKTKIKKEDNLTGDLLLYVGDNSIVNKYWKTNIPQYPIKLT